jgi:hypothetical protein
VQSDATRTCELLVGLRDVAVLGVDERLRRPLEVCVDPQHPGSIALSRSQKVQVSHLDAVTSSGHATDVPECNGQLSRPLAAPVPTKFGRLCSGR